MRSAVENVIRNAVRHTHEATTVEVAVERCNSLPWNNSEPVGKTEVEMVRVQVRDYGPGVRESMLREIFQPFHRGSQNPPANGNGSSSPGDVPLEGAGLGLAIADRVVRMHNGTIQAYNAIGNGLVIEIRLPLNS
jgi:two-component system sensor histidine kinase CpxA